MFLMNPGNILFIPDEHDAINLKTSYGWFKWRPGYLQKYGSRPVTFLIIICCCTLVQEFTVSGIVNVSVSSIERQFRLSSTQTGAVISAYDIAFLVASGPISWVGGRSVQVSKIRYLSLGLLCLAGGSIIFASPQFFTPPYELHSISQSCQKLSSLNNSNSNLKSSIKHSNAGPLIALLTGNVLHGIGSAPLYTLAVTYIDENSDYASVPLYLGIYYAVSVLGPGLGFLFGAFSLTFYVDQWRQTTSNLHLETSDPNWVGAWWLSFLVCAGLTLIVTIPLTGFPSHLPGMLEQFKARSDTSFAGIKRKVRSLNVKRDKNRESHAMRSIKSSVKNCLDKIWSRTTGESEDASDINRESVNLDVLNPAIKKAGDMEIALPLGCVNVSFGGVFQELGSLFTNVPYVFLTLAGAADGFILNSFAAFLPKYLEMQFAISAKNASLYVGILTVPAGFLGMFLGGYLIKKFNVSVVGMFKIMFWSSLVNMLCMFALLTTCPESKFAGVNYQLPYLINSQTSSIHGIKKVKENAGKIEFVCNLGCRCGYTYDPVCGSNNAMYYSACHAGCTFKGVGFDSRKYYGCDCVPPNLSLYNSTNISTSKNMFGSGSATLGYCSTDCARWKLFAFLGLMFFALFLLLMIAVIAVNCTLKCVEGAENSLAMGVQWVFVCLLGTIPGPIIFGKIIDRNCLFWEMRSTQTAPSIMEEIEYGSCKLYTNFKMGLDLFLLTLGCKIIAQLFYGVAYYSYWFYDKKPSVSSSLDIQTLELDTQTPHPTL